MQIENGRHQRKQHHIKNGFNLLCRYKIEIYPFQMSVDAQPIAIKST